MEPKLVLEVWSDIACPWCYVGKRRLESALEQFRRRDAVEIVWRSFELDPSAPKFAPASSTADPALGMAPRAHVARLAKKYGTSIEKAQAMIDNLTTVGQAEGLELRLDRVRPGNTFDAHRLIHLASAVGGPALQGVTKERLLRAYLTEGEEIYRPDTLVRLAAEVGLDADAVQAMLAGDAYTKEVREDESEASRLGIRGVPFFAVARTYGVSGAQPPDAMLDLLNHAWRELASAPPEEVAAKTFAEGAVCGPQGCA